jgi:hypothetical protein
MTEAGGPGALTLARAYAWSELRGQRWKLFAFPLGFGLIGAVGVVLALFFTPAFDPQTTALLREMAGIYFTSLPAGEGLVVAMLVVQGPSFVAMFAAVLSLWLVQSGLGQRLAVGEFELLLSGPYRDRDVFAALVVGATAIALAGVAIFAALTVGVGLVALLGSTAELAPTGLTLVAAGLLSVFPMTLWATFVGVVVYLVFPEAAGNNTHPGNLLAITAILPAMLALLGAATGVGPGPLPLAVGANVVPLAAIAIGWVTVRRWFSVEKVL